MSKNRLKVIFLGGTFFWSVMVVALAGWNYWEDYSLAFVTAQASARESYSKDLLWHWAIMNGGVYVPITRETPPNPYLAHIPERDISTPSGKKLTLINPAYMTRQVLELGGKEYNVFGHITSLKPIRPENASDEWERRALLDFARGQKEVSSLELLGKETYLRLMRPLIVKAECLKCHQGYKVGDIRGGISFFVPWGPFRASLWAQLRVTIFAYGGIWGVGMLGFYFGKKQLQNYLSARKQAEEALIEKTAAFESEKRYHDLIELSPDAIIVHSEGKFVYLNPVALALYNAANADEIVGKDVLDQIHPDDRGAIKNRIAEVYKYKPLAPLRATKILRLDGRAVDVETTGSRIIYQGKPAMQVILRDITERKQAEIDLQKRTVELEEANKELDGFNYSVAHDLRGPLRVIDGYSRMLLKNFKDKLEEEAKGKLDAIRDNAKKMNQLIEDILAFSRLGRRELKATVLDTEKLVAAVWEELQQNFPQRRVELNISPLPVACRGDEHMIRQVFTNLLSNALKFTKDREQVNIAVGGEEKMHECVYYVKDNGAGFDMRYADKLFGLFQRLHSEEEFEGTGVGLSFVKRIIERHGGRVWAEAKVNEGATFYFTLPKEINNGY